MIDTVRFHIPQSMPSELMKDWLSLKQTRKGGNTWRKYSICLIGPFGTKVTLKYYPQDRKGEPNPLIQIETSLPKFYYGNNVQMLFVVTDAVKQLEAFLIEPLGRKVDLMSAELGRIDLCYNHQVGTHVDDYIKYLFRVEHPTKKTKPYYPSYGVHFYAPSHPLSFYNKYLECMIMAAIGILRQELSLGTKRYVRQALGDEKKRATIADFTLDAIQSILQRELDRLGLHNVVIADKPLALKALLRKYGSEQGMRLFGYMCAMDIDSTKVLKEEGVSKQTISRNMATVKKANLARGLTDKGITLPTLTIDYKSLVE